MDLSSICNTDECLSSTGPIVEQDLNSFFMPTSGGSIDGGWGTQGFSLIHICSMIQEDLG